MTPKTLALALLLLCAARMPLCAQDTPAVPGAQGVAARYLDAVAGKSGSVSGDIDKQTSKYLAKLQRREAGIYKKLAKKDSTAATKALAGSKKQYEALQQKLSSASQLTTRSKK